MDVIVLGALGRMGRELCNACGNDINIVAQVDCLYSDEMRYTNKYRRLCDVKERADVLVNFAHHSLASEVAEFVKEREIALCEFCTGHDDNESEIIKQVGKTNPVFFAKNTALGIAYIADIASILAAIFPDAEIEIVEAHHSNKADAPSGTALMLANEIIDARGGGKISLERLGVRRGNGEIGIHSIRLGEIFGEHSVYIDTGEERIVLKHIALSRRLYCKGAERAMRYIYTKSAGVYGMRDLIGEYKTR